MNWTTLLDQLAQPFPPSVIQWRAGATSRDKKKAQALPYVDPREYERRLDTACPGAWSVTFKPWGERIICELTIHDVKRSSTGESDGSGFAVGTAAEAQAFKRACSKFGLGRHLYDMHAPWMPYDKEKRRLLETPRAAKSTRAQEPAATPAAAPATLSRNEAEKLHKRIGELYGDWLKRNDHYRLCEPVLGHEPKTLTVLTRAQAKDLLEQCRQEAYRRKYIPVSDEEALSVLN